jgi:outer membrane protein assembly factor BamB
VLVALGALGATWAGVAHGAQAAPRPAGAPASQDAEASADRGRSVFVRPSRELIQNLQLARQLVAQRRYAEAVGLLDTILDSGEDYFLLDKKSEANVGLKAEAQRLLGQMPRQGKELYELRYGARARQMLRDAATAGDPSGLAEVSRRYFHTQAGYEATLLLGLYHLDRGSPLAGALTLKRLREVPEAAEQFEPGLSVAMAACWLRAGFPDSAKAILDAVRQKYPKTSLQIAGAETALAGDPTRLIGSNPAVGAGSADASSWGMFRGNAARNASASGGGPLLSVAWRVPTTEHPHVEELVTQISRSYRQRDEWALPALHPLVVGDTVLLRTVRNLVAVDFVTGKLLWEVPTDDPFEAPNDSPVESPFFQPQQPDLRFGLRYRLWGDATYGTLSSDGERVFAVEDLSLDLSPSPSQNFAFNPRETRPDPRAFNRLAAYDIRTGKLVWHVGGSPEEPGLPLAGTFFLGPPLPLTGQLYVLAEAKSEIRLLVLDARTGTLQWTQQLAVVDQDRDVLFDPLRRMAGVSCSYADGVLVCPTSNRSIVALDLATRSLVWGYAYDDEKNADVRQGLFFGARSVGLEPEPAARWTDSSITLAEGKAIVTPVDGDFILCLDLISGKLLWKAPREDSLYVACVYDGKVIVVGRRGVRAFALGAARDGANHGEGDAIPEPAWDGRTVEFPSGSMPSGTGFLSEGLYHVPLSGGEVLAIDVKSGTAARTYRSRRGVVPGNLVCCRGRIVSQGAGAVELFYQLETLRKAVEGRLADHPDDPEALAQRGEILWDEGKLDEAIASLRRAYELGGGPHHRALLREAYLDGLRTNFATYRARLSEIETLLDEPQHQKAYLRVVAQGLVAAGEYRLAIDPLVRLMALDRRQRAMERLDKVHQVRGDRWIQIQLAAIRQAALPDVQSEIDRLARSEFDAATKSGDPEAIPRFLDYFGGLPVADEARWLLAEKHRQAGRYLQAELLLRRLERSSDRAQAARAAARMATMLREANLPEHAARAYARLARHFGDAVCLEGKTGRQLVDALPADDPVRKLLEPDEPWPVGKVAIAKERPKTPLPPAFTTAVVATPEGRGQYHGDVTLELQQSTQSLVARNGWGSQLWQMPAGDLMRQARFSIHAGSARAGFQDHLLLLSIGSGMVAVDTFPTAGGGVPTPLWSVDTDQPARLSMRVAGVANRRALQPFPVSPAGSSFSGPLALSEQLVCYLRFHELFGVDPATGQTLWVREDIRPESTVFGDEQYLFVLPVDESVATVLRAGDGTVLGTRPIPPGHQTAIGRLLVVWNNEAETSGREHAELSVVDAWTSKPIWPPRKFPADAKFALLEREAAGILDPAGRFVLVRLADGNVLVDAKIAPERALAEIYLFESPHGYLLIANGLERSASTPPQIYGIHGVPGVQITRARVYGFDHQGKKLWNEPAVVEDQFLLTNQPVRLPALIFACGTNERRTSALGQQRVAWVAVDKRTGRVLRPQESADGSTNLRLVGDPEKKIIDIHLQREVVRLAFTDQPIEPEPPPAKTTPTRALWKALIPDP